MKKNGIIEKARRRAIKALGGYSYEDIYGLQFGNVKKYTKMPVRLMSCYMNHLSRVDDECSDFVKGRLIDELAKGILRDNLYTLSTSETDYGVEYSMTVEIIPPGDGW